MFQFQNRLHMGLSLHGYLIGFLIDCYFFYYRFERVLGPCSEILKRNIQQYNSYVSLSV